MKRDFLHVSDFTSEEIYETLELAKWVKDKFKRREKYFPFDNHSMAMIFAMIGVLILLPSLIMLFKK